MYDVDQLMRQRALELAHVVCDSVGDYNDALTIANEYFQFMKSGDVPTPPADGE